MRIKNEGSLVSRWQAVKEITTEATIMLTTFSYSFSAPAIAAMIAHLNNEGDSVSRGDAAILINTFSQLVIIVSLSPLFSTSLSVGPEYGSLTKMQELKKALEKSNEAFQEKIRELQPNNTEFQESKEETNIPTGDDALSKLIAEIKKSDSTQYNELLKTAITERNEVISKFLKNTLFIGTAISAIAIPIMLYSKPILQAFNQSEEATDLAQNYLWPFAFAFPGILSRMSIEQIIFGTGKVLPLMILGPLSFGVGTGIAYRLASDYGIRGISYGYLIESYLTCFLFGAYLSKGTSFKDFNFFKNLKNFFQFDAVDRNQIKKIFKMGWPMTLEQSSTYISQILITIFSGLIDPYAQDAQNCFFQYLFLVIMPIFAVGQVAAQKASRALGAAEYENATRYSKYGCISITAFMAATGIALSLNPQPFVSLFSSNDPNLTKITNNLMPLAAATGISLAVSNALIPALRNINDLNKPALIYATGLWAGVGTAAYFTFNTGLGIYGINIPFAAGLLAACVGLTARFLGRMSPQAFEQAHKNTSNESAGFAENLSSWFCCKRKNYEKIPTSIPAVKEIKQAPKPSSWGSWCCWNRKDTVNIKDSTTTNYNTLEPSV